MIKKHPVRADELKDNMLIDFDGGEPGVIHNVVIGQHRVNFKANGTEFSIERDEILYRVTRMTLICGGKS